MKKVLYFSLVLTVMLAMVSCPSSTNSPGAAMKEYSKYLQKGDYVKFVDGLAFLFHWRRHLEEDEKKNAG